MKDLCLLVKPASGLCNMRCRYCFYADEMQKRETGERGMMSTETADALITKALGYADGSVTFAFQGGEPTLRGLPFFRYFTEKVKRIAPERKNISYTMQTNGLLIDDEWAAFFRENGFLIGLSLDGNRETHDLNRVDASGKGTSDSVMRAARVLEKAGVPFNVLTVVTSRTAKNIGEIYKFYRRNNLLYQQYIPCLDPIYGERGSHPYSLTSGAFGDFLIRLFDLWYDDKINGRFIYVHYFENLCGILLGKAPASCGMNGICSVQSVIEADGSVYPCDFYSMDEYLIGNIAADDFVTLDERRMPFLRESAGGLEKCRTCRFGPVCRGGCRRDRQYASGLGENCFCGGYAKFFGYALPKLIALLHANGYRL